MTGEGRPRSKVAIVDRALANMFSVEHAGLAHISHSTLKDRARENWEVYTKGLSK